MTLRHKLFIWTLRCFAALVVIAIGAVAFAPLAGRTTNCGGNSSALATCGALAGEYALWHREDPSEPTTFESVRLLTGDVNLAMPVATSWVSQARFLVWDPKSEIPTDGRVLIVVCDRPYSNVPEPTIWNLYRAHPSHAVGYSDGSVGLISPADFAGLDLSHFVDVRDWLPPAAFKTGP